MLSHPCQRDPEHRARLMRVQAAHLLETAHELHPLTGDAAAVAAVFQLAAIRRPAVGDQQGHDTTNAVARAVAPQGGEHQSIDLQQGVHGGDSECEGGTPQ